MKSRFGSILVVLFFFVTTSSEAVGSTVAVRGKVAKPLVLDMAKIQSFPAVEVEVDDHGKAARFRGVALSALLTEAGAPRGEELRGKQVAKYLLVIARDGYRAVYALPELDPAFTDRAVILAYERDGKPLSEEEGPFRIIAAGEKRAARWVRQVDALELLEAPAP